MGIVRGAGVIRWGASDGHSPYIGENGNWWQWNETVGDFVDTGVSAKGVDGMPGQVPIQKEWKEGDTHRNDTNIVDFIYVRAALSADRKWYKLNDNYVTRTVPAGETEPSAATIAEYYEEIPWLSALAVNVLIAEEANLANFIFKDGKLISVRGTVDGVAADYAGQSNFIPNIILDGKGVISVGDNGSRIVLNPVEKSLLIVDENNDTLGRLGYYTGLSNLILNKITLNASQRIWVHPQRVFIENDISGGDKTTIILDVENKEVQFHHVNNYGTIDNIVKINLLNSSNKLGINIKGLPSSPTGLVAGDLYRDSNGFLKVV